MPRPPPTSTLFPYTTLFRSLRQRLRYDRLTGSSRAADSQPVRLPFPRADRVSALFFAARQVLQDRKSTRLNSSHSSISYAVFCLKKKKKHYSIFSWPW